MTREAAARRHDDYPNDQKANSTVKPRPGWFFPESADDGEPRGVFEPQLDVETVRDYWRSRTHSFPEPPELDSDISYRDRPASRRESFEFEDAREPSGRSRAFDGAPVRTGFAAATLLALSVGGIGGFIIVDQVSGGGTMDSARTWARSLWSAGAPSFSSQRIAPAAAPVAGAVKSVLTATLQLVDVQGEANALIPLRIMADAGMPGRDIALRIEGLPPQARLTAGTRIGGTWLLRSDEIENIRLMVPEATAEPLALAVSAIEPETGALASPVKALTVTIIPPAAKVGAVSASMPQRTGAMSAP